MKYHIHIDPTLYQTYASIRLGCMRFSAQVKPSEASFWHHLNTEVFPSVRENIHGKAWSEISGVRGSRLAYKAFGRDAARYRVSSESLLRRVRRGDELYHINSVVDVNNLISVTTGLSVGSYDVSKIHGDVVLRVAREGEGYEGIGKQFINMRDMLELADEDGIFGSSMSDSQRTMVTESTTDIMVVIWCFEDTIDLSQVMADAAEAFQKYAGATAIETWIV